MSTSNDPIALGVNVFTVPVFANPIALRSSAIPTVCGPTRLRLPDLLRITDQAADEVLGGRYNHLLPSGGIPTQERGFTRLHSDDEVDVWLISWAPNQATELHDHGGSLGALTAAHHWSTSPRPVEEQALNRLGDSMFRAAVCALPEQYRLAVYYADVEGLRSREIADLMHTPVGTVMSRLHRGRCLLRRLLNDVAEQRGYTAVAQPARPEP
jgi:hypothetical protein